MGAKSEVFKPRAKQSAREQYVIGAMMSKVSEELTGAGWVPEAQSNFTFYASEVEVYAVLSVARPGDAVWMLSKGVRTAEAAADYMHAHGAEDKMVKRTIIAAEALRRGIPSREFMYKLNLAIIAHPDDDSDLRVMDVMELSTISSLSDQWGWVAVDIKNGVIRLEDIKYLGVSKMKSYRRLGSIKGALRVVHEPGAKFSMDDLKYLVDRGARDRLAATHFNPLVEYLVGEGLAGIKKLDSLKLMKLMCGRYYGEQKLQRVTYEIDFREVYERPARASFPEKELVELFDAGVPAARAAQLMSEGLPVKSVIGIAVGGVEKALADGWL